MTANSGLHVEKIVKRYGDFYALNQVSVAFRPGEIHAVLGENGAGKSTLVGILSGFVRPDSGQVTLNGTAVPIGLPFECKKRGIEMIHQHFTLVAQFSVAENFALARLPGLATVSNVSDRAAASAQAAERLGWKINLDAKVGELSVGEQQRVEILKALGGNAEVVIFDEPTAVLSADEVQDLFRVLRQLRDDGKIVILIAHKLSEVLSVADRVTVLRRGEFVATTSTVDTSESELASWMVGELPAAGKRADVELGPVQLIADQLTVKSSSGIDAVKSVRFDVRAGEVLGIGGVDGNGQFELAEALVGLRPVDGTLTFCGEPISPNSVRIAYIPQDRHHDGLALTMSIEDNLLITGHRRPDLASGPFLNRPAIRQWADQLRQRFSIKADSVTDLVGGLSGGNQQKVVVSRELAKEPQLLVAVNPTRGLDLKATEYVHQQIQAAKRTGASIVLITTDLDELFQVSDRVMFINGGSLRDGSSAEALLGAKD